MNKIIISIAIGLLLLGGLIWIARPEERQSVSGSDSGNVSNGTLAIVDSPSYDFGSISMAAGKVKTAFKVKNTSAEEVTITKVYTSCMCTTATLVMENKKWGPYGMQGHGVVPSIKQLLRPGEEGTVEIVFDPAAHGPAGVGRIERVVMIENNAGQPLEFNFSAVVTP